MKTTANADNGMGAALKIREIAEKRAALEAGMKDMERGLAQLGIRIDTCREQITPPSDIANMAVKASRMERKFLSLKKQLRAADPERLDANTRDAIRELAAQTRAYRFNTRALEQETRKNCEILHSLADKLKLELAERRARELREAREKAARIRVANFQAKPKTGKAEPKKSAVIIPFKKRGE